uniref:Mex-3 RNA binding family member D n=1 Tax=Hippocampus comes TaxID=109280 RepID=A0A3Q2XAM9_HIPCM
MPSPLFHPDIMDHDVVISSQHNGVGLPRETDQESRDEDHQEVLRFALDQLSLMALEKVDCGGGGGGGGLVDTLDGTQAPASEGYADLQISRDSPTSCSPSPEYYGSGGYHMWPSLHLQYMCPLYKHNNMVFDECCKIKALRAKTNTYIKTPVRGEEPVFIVTGRREDVEMAKREIVSAAEHFSMIRASRSLPGPPHLPGQTTIQVRVPYRVVGLVVGPKGATIKRIQQQTHTYIVTPSREKDPVFEVTGMPENVDRAREEIETHITLRTGTFVDLQGDNDFHTNGTDVSLEGLGALSAGLGASLWSRGYGGGRKGNEGASPTSPFSTSSSSYSSCSASSLPGGSPTDSEGGAGGVGLSSGMLTRLKGGPGPGVAGLVGAGPGVNRDCFVCFESEVTAALVPCGHNLFCMECAGQICQSAEPECPVCHTPTTQCIRIFS